MAALISTRDTLAALGKLAVALALVGFLIWRGDLAWEPLRASLIRWQYSLLALTVLGLTPILQLWRWQSLLRASRLRLPTREVFSYLMVSKFLNMALPGYFGGDFIRGVCVTRRASALGNGATTSDNDVPAQPGAAAVLPSIIFDRITGVIPLFAMALVGAIGGVWFDLPAHLLIFAAALSGGGLLAAAGLFGLAYWRPEPPDLLLRISERLGLDRPFLALFSSSYEYVRNRRLIGRVLGISFLSQGLILLGFLLFGGALDLGIPLVSYLVLVPLGLMVTAVPISPAGLGVGQVTFLALFQMAGTPHGANLFTLYMAASALVNMSGAALAPFLRLNAPIPSPASLARAEKSS